VSNVTDVDALAAEPGVDVLVTTDPDVVAGADLVVLPGTRSTVDDLRWLRSRPLADAITDRARRGAPVLGICGGHQMLFDRIHDDTESRAGLVEGLGLLSGEVRFAATKTLGRPHGSWRGEPVAAYEIHHGTAHPTGADEPFLDGVRRGAVFGTMWHGAFENDGFRRAWLTEIAALVGKDWHPDANAPGYGQRRETMIDTLADAVESHLDLELMLP
jgi:adenosylcobyric acid synthase